MRTGWVCHGDQRATQAKEATSGWLFNRFRVESGVKKEPTTQLEVKTLLNRIQRFVGFIYSSIRLRGSGGSLRLEVKIQPHRTIQGKCATCQQPSPGYDQMPERRWLFVPVRERLAIADAAAISDPRFVENVEALKSVQPEDLPAPEIDVRLGASWLPPEDLTNPTLDDRRYPLQEVETRVKPFEN
jgi:hypothetical protein